MKKIIVLMSIISSMILTIGCEDSGDSKSQVYDWPLATASSEDTVTHIYAQTFADEVNKLSNGEMRIKVYSNSVLGGDRELLESCKDGDIPFVLQSPAPQVPFIPSMALFDIPVAFDSIEEARNVLQDKEFQNLIQSEYNEAGYRLLGYADQGFRVMTTNEKIESIEDFKGQKIRTMENANHIAFWKSIGSNATPMSFSEVYIGLQQNTIDAQENSYETMVSNKLYEQQDYLLETNHVLDITSLIVNEDFYNELTPEEQKIIQEASDNASKHAIKKCDERIEQRRDYIQTQGVEIIDLSEEVKKDIKDLSNEMSDEIKNQIDDELVNAFINE